MAASPALSLYDRAARVHDLAEQTADAFDAYNEYFGGRWELRIRAAGEKCPIIYANLKDEQETPTERVARLERELIAAKRAAYPDVSDWRVVRPEDHNSSIVGMFFVLGHRPEARS